MELEKVAPGMTELEHMKSQTEWTTQWQKPFGAHGTIAKNGLRNNRNLKLPKGGPVYEKVKHLLSARSRKGGRCICSGDAQR